MTPDQAPPSFATLLRQLRTDAGLTQEELAETAGLSTRSVSDLERAVNLSARRETARLLADALRLTGPVRIEFEAAAKGRVKTAAAPGGVAAATRTLPRDVTSFTGRDNELAVLVQSAGGIWAIGGMAGVGKTAFAVHAAHQLAPQFPDGQVYLQLHGHSPAQPPVDPADALASLLLTAGLGAQQIPPGLEERSRLWRDHIAGARLLLVLDDAAGHEQVRPLLPGTAGSLVLITSRRHLSALEDTQVISLDTLSPVEAAELLTRLAARPAGDLDDGCVNEITRLCGYLPLAIGMLGRQLCHHPAWTCARLAADLASARDRLAFMRVENLSVAAAFDLSYQDLTPGQQQLFRRLGLHPGPDLDAGAAAALDDSDLQAARRQLDELYDQHLITELSEDRYRMHDLIREHARTLAAADPAGTSAAAVGRLRHYYAHAAARAGRLVGRKSPGHLVTAEGPVPASPPELTTRAEASAWLDAERLNLHAIASDAASGPDRRSAIVIPAAVHGFLRDHGYWDQALSLHQLALTVSADLADSLAEAGVRTDLGEIQQLTGDYPAAIASLTKAAELYRKLGSDQGQASALNELGIVRLGLDDYEAAVACHQQALALYQLLGDRSGEASALNELGLAQRATGDYEDAKASHEEALRRYRATGNGIGEASALNRLGQVLRSTGDYAGAARCHEQALRLHREHGNRIGEATALYGLGQVHQATANPDAAIARQEQALRLARDLNYPVGKATALAGLGAAQLSAGDVGAAIASYTEALALNRELGHRIGQVTALGGLGAARLSSGDPAAATASLGEALRLTRQTGHRAGEADTRHVLATVAIATGDHEAAVAHLDRALLLYTELGVRHGKCEVLNTYGELLLARGDHAGAQTRFGQARRIALDLELPTEQARAEAGLSRVTRP